MITDQYDLIWDCCCDHGLLGMALLQRGAAGKVHFVDLVPSLTDALQVQLERFSEGPLKGRDWQVDCMDVSTLKLPVSSERQLIIIAGVGGDLTLEMVQAISRSHPDRALEFMLCPVRQHYLLRQGLIALGYGLVDEALVRENKRFYEMIHVSSESDCAISPVGDRMWDLSRALDREYLSRTIAHYERMGRNTGSEAERVLAHYRELQKGAEYSRVFSCLPRQS